MDQRADLRPAEWKLLLAVKRSGPVFVEDLAHEFKNTVSAVRQHLTTLEDKELVTYRRVKDGPGRPQHLYELTSEGHRLIEHDFKSYFILSLALLNEKFPAAVLEVFLRDMEARVASARFSLGDLTGEKRLEKFVENINLNDYFARLEKMAGGYELTVRNCPASTIGCTFGEACQAQLSFVKHCLPDMAVSRDRHEPEKYGVCGYLISPAPKKVASST